MTFRSSSSSGFSLIEIVVAVSIMALAVGLIVPTVFRYVKRAKLQTTKVALKSVKEAIELFDNDTGFYPETLQDLMEKPANEKLAKGWSGPYLEGKTKDGYGHDLVYSLNPKGTKPPYQLYSWGPNGEGSPEEEWIFAGSEEKKG